MVVKQGAKLKPNIFFLVIDGLRSDRCFGNNGTSKTPNINKLKKTSLQFTNLFGTSTVTGTCLGCTFSGLLPFKTGNTLFHLNKEIPTIFDVLKNNGYDLHATIPNLTWFEQLTESFDCVEEYDALDDETRDTIFNSVGDKIINKLNTMNSPWVFFTHIFDLHIPTKFDSEFSGSEFGQNKYDKSVSCIDSWLGKFLEKIDLKNTIIIITSDHGEIIPKVEFDVPLQTTKKLMKSIKKRIPVLEPLGVKLYEKMSHDAHLKRIETDSHGLENEEKRTLITRGLVDLVHDDLIHIPLIIHTPDNIEKDISQLTRQVDISPTILEILGLKFDDPIDGNSLFPIIQGNVVEEEPAYIESGSNKPDKLGKFIGIRTSKFKYQRSRKNAKKDVSLFDIEIDPLEKNNIAIKNPKIIKNMENLLSELMSENKINTESNLSKSEDKEIEDELRKLGYI
tara:strand:+ start:489 stop:1841 length:1353 start_codon:yes stop_codon:yes gene_type:complete